MSTNSLKLNESKTEVIAFSSAHQLTEIKLHALRIGDCLLTVTVSVMLVSSVMVRWRWSHV